MEVSAVPYVIRPPVRKLSLAGALAILAACVLLVPSLARADDDDDDRPRGYGSSNGPSRCEPVPVANPFSIFGDVSDYTLVGNGDFESGTGGWSLSRARVVGGNAPLQVRDALDGSSLSISPFGSATSPRFCVDNSYPHFRFFARLSQGTSGALWVRARWTEGDDVEQETLGYLSGSDYLTWAPSQMLPLAERVKLTDRKRTQNVRLVFRALFGTWQIDDVYVDPYRR
jgi:hypothetical protein